MKGKNLERRSLTRALAGVTICLGLLTFGTKALAEEPSIQFLNAIASRGCRIDKQLIGSDGRTLSLFLQDMRASGDSRRTCLLRVDTLIPSGFHVQDVQFLYQGSTEVASGSKGASLSRSYTFTGGALGVATAKPQTTNFKATEPLFQVQDPVTVASASCGGQGQLGVNMIAKSSPGSSIYVDTADVNAGHVQIHLDIAPCK